MKKILFLCMFLVGGWAYGQIDSVKVSTPDSGTGDPLRTAFQKVNLAIDQINLNAPAASPTFTGTVTLPALKVTTGAAVGNMLWSDADGDIAYLSAGATTDVLVGGGAAVPVWTTATGTGAPVRAGSPTITTQLTIGTGVISAAEAGYIDPTSSIQTQINSKQSTLTNSAGLRGALSDETGTGLAVFGTSPTIGGTITMDNGATIVNTDASTLTITEANTNIIGDLGATGTRVTKGWFTDIDVSNAITGATEYVKLVRDTLYDATTVDTLALTDAGKICRYNNAAQTKVYIPTNATVAFLVGTQIDIKMDGTGIVGILGVSGVIVQSEKDSCYINNRHGWASIIKRATDKWDLLGSLKD